MSITKTLSNQWPLMIGLILAAAALSCGRKEERLSRDQITSEFKKDVREGDPNASTRALAQLKLLEAQDRKDRIAVLPKDEATLAILDRAGDYYTDTALLWSECLSTAELVKERSGDADPREILKGSIEVMRRLHIRPRKDQHPRGFMSIYQNYRESDNHQASLDRMVELEKFANKH